MIIDLFNNLFQETKIIHKDQSQHKWRSCKHLTLYFLASSEVCLEKTLLFVFYKQKSIQYWYISLKICFRKFAAAAVIAWLMLLSCTFCRDFSFSEKLHPEKILFLPLYLLIVWILTCSHHLFLVLWDRRSFSQQCCTPPPLYRAAAGMSTLFSTWTLHNLQCLRKVYDYSSNLFYPWSSWQGPF